MSCRDGEKKTQTLLCSLTFVAQLAHVVWTLAMNLHVVRDVSSTKELPTDMTGDLLLVSHHVRSQTVLRSEGSFTGLLTVTDICFRRKVLLERLGRQLA